MKTQLGAVTSIVIAHRLSTIKKADRIIVMKKGKIIEDGDHDSLLRDYPGGVYAKLVNEAENAEMEEQGETQKVEAEDQESNEQIIVSPTSPEPQNQANDRLEWVEDAANEMSSGDIDQSIPDLKYKPSEVQVNEDKNEKNPAIQVEDEELPDPLDYMPRAQSKISKKQSVMNIDD